MTDAAPVFVQFPHPGGEYAPPEDVLRWNPGPHRRKFLVSSGRYASADGGLGETELAFWGEWEPPSRIVKRWQREGALPRAMHRPFWVVPQDRTFRMNTDPWVFGDRMLYSNCKQTTDNGRRPTAMQALERGSVVCFGSTIHGAFCVDTVFVVASGEPWTPQDPSAIEVDEAFRVCTVEASATAKRSLPVLMLYWGATFDDPVEGMFSFVPARRADEEDGPRFARPAVDVPGFINPENRQSTWGSRRRMSLAQVRTQWQVIRDQVLGAGLVLAVHLATPPCEGVSAGPTGSKQGGCTPTRC
jgi:hypothetical protein